LVEARVAGMLQHPNIVQSREVGESDGVPYLVLDLVEGMTLSQLISQQGPLPEEEAIAIAGQMAEALGFAHRHGIVHGDFKPANILVDAKGQAYLTDFGIAHALAEPAHLTRTAGIVGTPEYMAPEQ